MLLLPIASGTRQPSRVEEQALPGPCAALCGSVRLLFWGRHAKAPTALTVVQSPHASVLAPHRTAPLANMLSLLRRIRPVQAGHRPTFGGDSSCRSAVQSIGGHDFWP